jgi:lysyl-tRNA synthetase class 1
MSIEDNLALLARAWPFEEARKLLSRVQSQQRPKPYVLFETGYGPSGLPHIGTFSEVVRTTMVRQAFYRLANIETRLFAFSDDMDGFRRVPDNVPNGDVLAQHLGKPLTSVPDPFGTHPSFGAHNNARLQTFLDQLGFEYEFKSATECYKAGIFDTTLLAVLRSYEDIMAAVLPTLGPDRRATYSPFLPICPRTGVVLQVPLVQHDAEAGTVVYRDPETARLAEVPVTGGHCKLGWKVDWAMRWVAFGVDYEMSGKDLIDSVRLSSRICRILGARPPENFTYELFLDGNGEKISKSRGNGLTIEEWLTYAPEESLSLFMYQKPRAAKRLHFDVIPRCVDEYLTLLDAYKNQTPAEHLENPVWHIHDGDPPPEKLPVTFGLLLHLASACHTNDKSVIWGFISRYAPGATLQPNTLLDRLIDHALAYYRDFVKPRAHRRAPTDKERRAIEDLLAAFQRLPSDSNPEMIQNQVYQIGKDHGFNDLREWFKALYEVLLGTSQGPRMGTFAALYGLQETTALLRDTLESPAAAG